MLQLLKNYRNQTSKDGRLMKYFLYALGEIFLVVIGILIAVQIDNWNETRKKEEAFREIMETISKDIKADIEEYDFLLRKRYRNDSLLREVINGKIQEEDYRKNWKELKSLITTSTSFYVHQNGFLALQKIMDDVPKPGTPFHYLIQGSIPRN